MKRTITFILFLLSLMAQSQTAIVYFADANFKNAVIADGVDTNGNGQIEVTEAEAVSTLSVDSSGITDLTGIGSFSNITILNINNNNLSSLDLHNNTNLITVNASMCGSLGGNINLSGLSNVRNLDIHNCGLTDVDLSDLSDLDYLKISTNSLSELNLQDNTSLTELEALAAGEFHTIDLSTNTLLSSIKINGNNIYELDLSTNTELNFLYCNDNHLSSLNISNKLDLRHVECRNNDLVNLTLKNIEDGGYPFDYLDCSGNDYLTCIMVDDPATFDPATEILPPDAEYNTTCEEQVYIEDQWFEFKLIDQGIDTGNGGVIDHKVAKIAVFFLEDLDINVGTGADITSIRGIEAFEALKNFTAHENAITKADFTKNTALEFIRLDDNALTEINVSTLVNLQGLRVKNNALTEIDVTQNTALENLDINGNSLTELDLTQNTALTSLYALNNAISSINLYNNENLTIVNIDNNNLSVLSVNNHPDLVTLHCANNNLTLLNLSPDSVNLENLYCNNNQLTNNNVAIPNGEKLKVLIANDNLFSESMDFNENVDLVELNLANNVDIEQIAIRNGNNAAITLFDATGCTNLQVVCVDDADVAPTATGWSVDDTSVYNTCTIEIPDANFEQALIDLGIDTFHDDPSSPVPNGFIDVDDPIGVTYLDINNKNISNLTGINDFIDLEALVAYGNNLTGIDVSNLSNLRTLNLRGNHLDSYYMTLPNPTDLRNLYIDNNQEFYGGNSIDDVIANQTLLEKLTLADNNAHSLELTNFPNLLEVNCSNNPNIDELDVSNSPLLRILKATDCSISTLNVSSINSLDEVQVQNNNMISLVLGNQPHLNSIRCFDNALTDIDVSSIPTLGFFSCSNNQLSSLDVSNNHQLGYLSGNNNTTLTFLNLNNGNNDITLNEVYATNLGTGCCIQVDDETNVPAAWVLDTTDTTISNDCTPDYTAIPDSNFENALKGLGYDDSINGQVLTANINTITSIDLSGQNIADLTGIEDFTALEELYVYNNDLTSIDLYNNTALTVLSCGNNDLVTLDVSNNVLLTSISCFSNAITSLDFSANTELVSIYCPGNNLEELDVRNGNNTNITVFNSTNNPLLSCINVDDAGYSTDNWTNIDAASSFDEHCGETHIPDANFESYLETHNAAGDLVAIGDPSSMGNGIDNDEYVLTSQINTVTELNVNGKSIYELTGIEDFTALENLLTYGNYLTSIDLSTLVNLDFLVVSANDLTALNLDNNTNLRYLNCDNNAITSLNLDNNPQLIQVKCYNNALTEFSIQNENNPSIPNGEFNITGNPDLSCVFVDDTEWSEFNWNNIDATAHFVATTAECDAVLDISSDILEMGINLYPNPVNDLLTINVSNEIELSSITVFDGMGRKVNTNVYNNTISFENLSTGIYLVILQDTNGNSISKKIMKK